MLTHPASSPLMCNQLLNPIHSASHTALSPAHCLPHASSAALTSYLDYDKRQPTVSPICHLPSFQFMPWITALGRKHILLSLETVPWSHAASGSAISGPVRRQAPSTPSSLQFLSLRRCHTFFQSILLLLAPFPLYSSPGTWLYLPPVSSQRHRL